MIVVLVAVVVLLVAVGILGWALHRRRLQHEADVFAAQQRKRMLQAIAATDYRQTTTRRTR